MRRRDEGEGGKGGVERGGGRGKGEGGKVVFDWVCGWFGISLLVDMYALMKYGSFSTSSLQAGGC